jgi:hypothetical protein
LSTIDTQARKNVFDELAKHGNKGRRSNHGADGKNH